MKSEASYHLLLQHWSGPGLDSNLHLNNQQISTQIWKPTSNHKKHPCWAHPSCWCAMLGAPCRDVWWGKICSGMKPYNLRTGYLYLGAMIRPSYNIKWPEISLVTVPLRTKNGTLVVFCTADGVCKQTLLLFQFLVTYLREYSNIWTISPFLCFCLFHCCCSPRWPT